MNNRMKICIVGPSYPFRGGIAHYMTLLFKELKKSHEVKFFSFKKQYPLWLFPGKTDRDTSKQTIADSEIRPLLHSMNPLSWIHVFSQIRKYAPDLVIFPWWVAFWAPQFGTISWLVKKCKISKVLFICHNVVEHEANFLTKVLTKLVLKNGNCFIVHSDGDLANLKSILPEAKVAKSYHPTYEVFRQKGFDKKKAMDALDLSGNIILFFGFVRKYKGLRYLIEALPHILKQIDVTLLVVGEFWKDKSDYLELIEKLDIAKNVRIVDKYVPNEEVSLYFAACDLVVLPYTSATGSGIAQIAFSCEKPVITTKVGSLKEVVQDNETGFLVEANAPSSLSDAVVRFYSEAKEQEFVENIRNNHGKFSWENMRRDIEQLCSD